MPRLRQKPISASNRSRSRILPVGLLGKLMEISLVLDRAALVTTSILSDHPSTGSRLLAVGLLGKLMEMRLVLGRGGVVTTSILSDHPSTGSRLTPVTAQIPAGTLSAD